VHGARGVQPPDDPEAPPADLEDVAGTYEQTIHRQRELKREYREAKGHRPAEPIDSMGARSKGPTAAEPDAPTAVESNDPAVVESDGAINVVSEEPVETPS